jgi:putative membrane protein
MDGFIVLWQSIAMVVDVSTLYAGRPGFLGTVRLLRRALVMTVLAEIAEQATEFVADWVANKAAAKLSGRAVQGLGNGLLMLRLGNAVKRQCRPIAYAGGRVPARALVTEIARTVKNGRKRNPE